jgi:ABC-type Fe3+ transport system substrate-binding protein
MSATRWSGLALVVAFGTAFGAEAQTASAPVTLSPAEKIYADLAKLPPDERQRKIEEGARKEGALSLVQTLRGEVGEGSTKLFAKHYPFLKLDATQDIGSQDAAERLYAEEAAGRHLTDVISVAKADLVKPLRADELARYPSPATQQILPTYRRSLDPQNRWTPYYWSEYGISYNSNLVPPEHVPKTWMDLCDPFFKGSVSFEPAETRYLAGIYNIMGEDAAIKFLQCIGKNDPIVQRGHSQRIELMLAGDHMIQGNNYLYYGKFLQRKNPSLPYAMVLTTPLVASFGVAAINRNTPHPYASALYADWLLSSESQQWTAYEMRGPITMKHPFLPEDIKLVDDDDPPPDIAKRILATWFKYVETKKK